MQYPARFKADKEKGGYVVTFPDIPEAITQGDTFEEAMSMAQDALETAMEFYFDNRREVPMPSARKHGQHLVELPLSLTAKILLLNAMIRQGIKPAELARRIGTSPQEVNRLTTLKHSTKIDRIDDALKALGMKLELKVV
jgi:antitoxin HicB